MRLNFKFMQTDGVPLTADLMDTLQEAWSIFNVIGDVAGNLTILSGCEVVGTSVSPGIVVIDGDVLFFEGGTIFQTVFIHQEDITKVFKNQVAKILIEKRTVKFGNGNVNFQWSDFSKLDTLRQTAEKIEDLQVQINDLNFYFDNLMQQFNTHVQDVNNPHQTTALQVGILKKGSVYIGDVQGKNLGWSSSTADYTITLIQKGGNSSAGGDDCYLITFNSAFPDNNYTVLGIVRFNHWNNDNDIISSIGNKTINSFELSLREVSTSIQNINFDYVIFKN